MGVGSELFAESFAVQLLFAEIPEMSIVVGMCLLGPSSFDLIQLIGCVGTVCRCALRDR